MQRGNIALPLALVSFIPHTLSFCCLLNLTVVYSNLIEFSFFKPFSLSTFIFLSSAVILWPFHSTTQSSTTSQSWPWRAVTTLLQTPAISLIYSSLFSFSTSCCSLHRSKYLNLHCWALARGDHGLPPTKL